MAVVETAGAVLYLAIMAFGVIVSLIGAPGSVLVLLAGFGWSAFHQWSEPPWWLLVAAVPLAVGIELTDNLLSMWGVRRWGGNAKTMWWALVGGLVGALACSPLVPVIGPLFGALLGAFGAGYLYERYRGQSLKEAGRAGWGAVLGRVGGGLLKSALLALLAAVLAVSSF